MDKKERYAAGMKVRRAVLGDALQWIGRDAGINRAIALAGHDVNNRVD